MMVGRLRGMGFQPMNHGLKARATSGPGRLCLPAASAYPSPFMSVLERYFRLGERQTTAGREVRGAVATFLTMAYILFVNPNVLAPLDVLNDPSVPAAAKMPRESVLACTALAAGVCCILMGVVANFPIAMASGMGLNAMVAGLYVTGRVPSWRVAMGLIVLNGVFILVLVLLGLRESVMRAIPHDLRLAIGAGIGLFIAFIGFKNIGLIVPDPATYLTYTCLLYTSPSPRDS